MSLPSSLNPSILSVLDDIVCNVHIQPNFCISHPNYDPLEMPDEVARKLAKLPMATQHKYLRLQLRSFLQGIYYQGDLRTILAKDITASKASHSRTLEDKNTLGLENELFDQLHKANGGTGYFEGGWQVVRQVDEMILCVHKDDLTLEIKRDCDLAFSQQAATIGDVVAIKMPCNLLEQIYYVAVGNAGPAYIRDGCQTVNIYFNLSVEGAIGITKHLTQALNTLGIPFTFKVLYDAEDYGRYDAAMLNIERHQYFSIWPILQTIYQQSTAYFGENIPFLTKRLAPGLGLAEEADHLKTPEDVFGKNRYQIMANALLESWQQDLQAPEKRMDLISQHFSMVGIDLNYPYLNENSQDTYPVLILGMGDG